MPKTLIDQANEKLRKVQQALIIIGIDQKWTINNLQNEANFFRESLVALRSRLADLEQTKNKLACQEAIHHALVFFAKHYPLNKKTAHNELICPISQKVFAAGSGITLSNGCQYEQHTIGYVAQDRKYYPKELPGSSIAIDKQDVKEAQRILKGNAVILGMRAGSLVGMALWIASLALKLFIGANLGALLMGALVGLGIGTVAAGCIAGGVVLLPIIACVVVGGILGAVFFSKKYPSHFAPKQANEGVTSSTAVAFDKLDAESDYHLGVTKAPVLDEEAQPLLLDAKTEYVLEPTLLKR